MEEGVSRGVAPDHFLATPMTRDENVGDRIGWNLARIVRHLESKAGALCRLIYHGKDRKPVVVAAVQEVDTPLPARPRSMLVGVKQTRTRQ